MADDNVVPFTGEIRNRPPQTIEEVHEAVENIAIYHVDQTIGPIVGMLVDCISSAGFDVEGNQEECLKDMALVYTCLRSMLLKIRGVAHPFQSVAEETFEENGEGVVIFKANGEPAAPNQMYEEFE